MVVCIVTTDQIEGGGKSVRTPVIFMHANSQKCGGVAGRFVRDDRGRAGSSAICEWRSALSAEVESVGEDWRRHEVIVWSQHALF